MHSIDCLNFEYGLIQARHIRFKSKDILKGDDNLWKYFFDHITKYMHIYLCQDGVFVSHMEAAIKIMDSSITRPLYQ
jgi:hypothetical protein